MDTIILPALVGAFFATIVNVISNWLTTKKENKADKILIMAELYGQLLQQLRLIKNVIGHHMWYEFYHHNGIANPNIPNIQERIDNRVEKIDRIEDEFLKNDTKISVNLARYLKHFPKDIDTFNEINNLVNFKIFDNINLKSIYPWRKSGIKTQNANDSINDAINEAYGQLDKSLISKVEKVQKDLMDKIKDLA